MKPGNQFILTMTGGIGFGIFFFELGAFGIITASSNLYGKGELLFAGAGCIFLGLSIIWRFLQYLKPLEPMSQSAVSVCPYCGAVVKPGDERCQKCGKLVANEF